MAWLLLAVAGACEVVWAIALKQSAGFTKVVPSAVSAAFMVASVVLLALAMKRIPVGTAYAVWTGIGAVGVAVCGILFFDEPATLTRVFFLLLVLAGIVGLKFVSPS